MVEWGDWDGHWVAIIGYDNNGTPSIGDDTLIFADPYDTSAVSYTHLRAHET